MEDKKEDLFEKAILDFSVSEVSENNAWKSLVEYTYKVVPIDHCIDHFKNIEKIYKEKHNLSAMPGRYRSAKSIMVKVLSLDNSLMHQIYNDGDILPKNQAEKLIREHFNKKKIADTWENVPDTVSNASDFELARAMSKEYIKALKVLNVDTTDVEKFLRSKGLL